MRRGVRRKGLCKTKLRFVPKSLSGRGKKKKRVAKRTKKRKKNGRSKKRRKRRTKK